MSARLLAPKLAVVAAPPSTVRVSLHLVDSRGSDRGSLGEVFVTSPDDSGR